MPKSDKNVRTTSLIWPVILVMLCISIPALSQKPEVTIQSETSDITSFALSPNGKFILTSGIVSGLTIWDYSSRRQLRRLELPLPVGGVSLGPRSLAINSNGKLVAVASYDSGVSIWDPETKLQVRSIANEKSGNFVFFDALDRLFLASESKGIKVFDLASNRMIQWLDVEIRSLSKISISQNGERVAVTSHDGVEVWDVNNGGLLLKIPILPDSGLTAIALSPNGESIATCDYNGAIKLHRLTVERGVIELSKGKEVSSIPTALDPKEIAKKFQGIDFSKLSQQEIAKLSAQINEEMFKAVIENSKQSTAGRDRSISSFAFSSDGNQLAGTAFNGEVFLWNLSEGRKVSSFELGKKAKSNQAAGYLSTISFSPGGNSIAVARGTGAVEFLNIKGDKVIVPIGTERNETNDTLNLEDFSGWNGFSSNGLWFGLKAQQHLFWNLRSGGNPVLLPEGEAIALISPSKDVAVVASQGGYLQLRNIDGTGEPIMLGNSGLSYFSNFTSDGRYFATGDIVETELSKRLISEAMKSPGGAKAYLDNLEPVKWGGGSVKIWDIITNKAIGDFKLPAGESPLFSQMGMNQSFLSPDGQRFASITEGRTINLRSAKTGLILKQIHNYESIGIRKNGSEDEMPPWVGAFGAFDPTGRYFAVTDGKSLKLWDPQTGLEVATLQTANSRYLSQKGLGLSSVGFSADGKLLFSKDMFTTLRIWNVADKSELRPVGISESFGIFSLSGGFGFNISASSNGKIIAVTSGGVFGSLTEVKLFDVIASKMICRVFVKGDEWVVLMPDGRFDTNRLENSELLAGTFPNDSFKSVSLDAFVTDYYEPNLLPRLFKCTQESTCKDEFRTIRDISEVNPIRPKVKITRIEPTGAGRTVNVSVELEEETGQFQNRSQSSGVYDLRLFRNGQIVGYSTLDDKLRSTFKSYKNLDEELAVWRNTNKVDGVKQRTFKVKLPNNPNNEPIEFSAYAFNADRVKSETARITYTPKASSQLIESRKAYVVALGVNRSQDVRMNLSYAASDARATVDVLSRKLRERGEFSEVIEIPLISDENNQDATKENIQTVFELLSGKSPSEESLRSLGNVAVKIKAARPDDAVFIAFSSHGYRDPTGNFYILPSNIGVNFGDSVTNDLLGKSISSDELSLWLRDVDAGEMVMIIDACNAEWAVKNNDFKPAPMGSRGLGQLAFDKGMKILTATQAANVANEVKEIGGKKIEQGLLTYALIQDGLLRNEANFKPKDKIISLREWLEFAGFHVPKLYQEWNDRKSKNGRPKDIVDPSPLTESSVQQPYLFDFTRKKKELVLAKLP